MWKCWKDIWCSIPPDKLDSTFRNNLLLVLSCWYSDNHRFLCLILINHWKVSPISQDHRIKLIEVVRETSCPTSCCHLIFWLDKPSFFMLSSFDSAPDTDHVGGHPPNLPHLVDVYWRVGSKTLCSILNVVQQVLCWEDDNFPQCTDYTPAHTAQHVFGHLSFQTTLQSHVQFTVHWDLQGFFHRAPLCPFPS